MEQILQLPHSGNINTTALQGDGRVVAAVDIGTTKVITLVGREVVGGKVHVLAHSEEALPRGSMLRSEVLHTGSVRDAIAKTLADIREKWNIDVREVYVGTAGSYYRCLNAPINHIRTIGTTEITEYERKEMEEQMYLQPVKPGECILYVAPQEYRVDNYAGIPNPVGMSGKYLSANYRLFIGSEAPVENSNWCIRQAGLTLKKGLFKPIATAQAVLSDDEKEMGVAVVDMGGGTTNVVVYYDKIVRYSAIIPFGGNTITEDIWDGCGVMRRHANAIKIQYGSCYRDLVNANTTLVIDMNDDRETQKIAFSFLAGIIEARVNEIIEAVMYKIGQSGYADKLPGGLVFTGGGAMMQHLKEFATAKTGMSVRIVRPVHLTSDSPKDVRHCSYATAVGLLLHGIATENAAVITDQIPTSVQTIVPTTPIIQKEVDETVNVEESTTDDMVKTTIKKTRRKKSVPEAVGDLFKDFFKKDDGV
ncbi:MAG: cell division protein FtsA [Prevotellaceae bacterium]|jgi:cell division protein FtsA|nr:cell division protein FtsA [Prevotellaceae bacterium]